MPEAMAALRSDSDVSIGTDRWLVFRPERGEAGVGLVLYPGGRVDPRSYAPVARALAEESTLVLIVRAPQNLAVLGAGRGAEVMAAYPEVAHEGGNHAQFDWYGPQRGDNPATISRSEQ